MGGQSSRMVREIVEDSLYIIRQTDRATYQRSVAAHQEVQEKLEELRRLNKEMIHSAEQDDQRTQVFRSFEGVDSQKKQLDEVTEKFAKQFELPKGYTNIADHHRAEREQAKKEQEQQTKTSSSPESYKDAL